MRGFPANSSVAMIGSRRKMTADRGNVAAGSRDDVGVEQPVGSERQLAAGRRRPGRRRRRRRADCHPGVAGAPGCGPACYQSRTRQRRLVPTRGCRAAPCRAFDAAAVEPVNSGNSSGPRCARNCRNRLTGATRACHHKYRGRRLFSRSGRSSGGSRTPFGSGTCTPNRFLRAIG